MLFLLLLTYTGYSTVLLDPKTNLLVSRFLCVGVVNEMCEETMIGDAVRYVSGKSVRLEFDMLWVQGKICS